MASLMVCNHSWLYYISKARTFVFKDLTSGLSVCKWVMPLNGSEGWGRVDGFIKLPTPLSSSGLYRATWKVLECGTPVDTRLLCYSHTQEAAPLCIWKTHLQLAIENGSAAWYFQGKHGIVRTVTPNPGCHQAQDTHPHTAVQVC